MSLAFLNKKSWHTATIRNAERVWKAEQKQKAEQRKIEQLLKEKEEERQIEELRRLQAASGLNIKTHGDRVDWMYEGVHAQGPTSEEYLLGKKFEGNLDGEKDDVLKIEQDGAAGSMFINKKVNEEMEERARLREDPLVAIMHREQAARAKILNNPVEMEKIQKKTKEMRKLKKWRKKQMKKEKKKRKKEKKRLKKEQKENEQPPRDDSDSERDHSPKRSRKRDVEDPHGGEDSRRQNALPALPPSSRNKYGLILNPNASPPPVKARNRSSSPPSEKDEERDRRSGSRPRRNGRRDRSRSRSRSRSRDRRRVRSRSAGRRRRRGRYSPSPDSRRNKMDRDRRDRRHGRDRRGRDEDQRHDREPPKRKLTREERLAKLQEMQDDAEAHEDEKLDRVRRAKAKAEQERQEEDEKKDRDPNEGATFIRKMNNSIYSGKESLESRLKKHQHYRQKGGDAMDASTFMSR